MQFRLFSFALIILNCMDYSHCQGNRWRRSKRGGCCSTRGAWLGRGCRGAHSLRGTIPPPLHLHTTAAHFPGAELCTTLGLFCPQKVRRTRARRAESRVSPACVGCSELSGAVRVHVRCCSSTLNSSPFRSHVLFATHFSCSSVFSFLVLLTISPAANVFTFPHARAPQTVTPDRFGHGLTACVCVCNRERESVSVGYLTEVEDLHFHEKGNIDLFFWNLRLNGMTY